MTKSSHSVHRDLAWALRQQARRAGEQATSVRGADWRLATVTAVHTDGTVTADGLRWRRMETYLAPAVDDVIAVTRSSNGNLLAWGRMGDSAAGTWTTIPPSAFASGWSSARANSGGPAQYRVIISGGTPYLELSGEINYTGSLPAATVTAFTLPAAARPANRRGYIGAKSFSSTAKYRADINPDGTFTIIDHSSTASTNPWFFLDGCRVRMD